MLEPRYRWSFPVEASVDEDAVAAGAAIGLSARVVRLLASRGVTAAEDIVRFFAPPEEGLHDPSLLPDAEVFLARIRAARSAGERILVFGDFDADGLTGLAIMTSALREAGCDAEPYVPSRLDEGHGLSMRAVETASAASRSVIVTVDCGTTSHAEIAAARERGIDVLVTDHHHVPATLPPALAVVNAHRPDSRYPDSRIAGSGVAFKLATLLLADLPGGRRLGIDLADLAAIGAVADVSPILGENRSIARLGLERLRTSPRPGIAALLARAGITPATVDLETIAFVIAPRLNAAGRVGEAVDAAHLLLATDLAEAERLAASLESLNATRREMTRDVLAQARLALVDEAIGASTDGETAAAIARETAAVVVRGSWPVGIVGLVAARLAEETGRPAVVGAEIDGIVRASCRNSGPLDLAAALDACGDLLIRYGGHRGAAGFEIPAERWDDFRSRFEALALVVGPPDPRPSLAIDLVLPAREVDYALLREIRLLDPTGPGNEAPLLAVLGATVTRVRSANGGHTQLTLRRERDVIDAIAFGRDDLVGRLAEGDVVDVVGRLSSRTFQGFESLQLEVRDLATREGRAAASLPLAAAATAIAGPL